MTTHLRSRTVGHTAVRPVDFSLANCFWWVAGGRSPPPTHQNSLYARSEDADIPSRCGPVRRQGMTAFCPTSAQMMFNGKRASERSLCGLLFLRRTVLCAWWAGFARPPRTQNSFHARGENLGAPPRCGPVRRQEVGAGLRPAPTNPCTSVSYAPPRRWGMTPYRRSRTVGHTAVRPPINRQSLLITPPPLMPLVLRN